MQQTTNKKDSFTFIDLFAGIGGLRLAFESANGKCIFTSENNNYATQTYQANFPDSEVHGDIEDIATENIPEHDVLLAGFSCQPFSSAGKKEGFEHPTQGTHFGEILRIIQSKKPHVFVLENVKNLLKHDNGNTFRVIRNELEEKLGYGFHYEVLDGKYFVPQYRQRVVIIGFRHAEIPFDFNKQDYISDNSPKLKEILLNEKEIDRKFILTDHLWNYLQDRTKMHKFKGNGFSHGLVKETDIARTLSARYHKDGSEILIFRGEDQNPRKLTPRECARIMGFDDSFQIPVSNTQAYQQFGNSVVIPLFKEIANNLKPYILGSVNNIPLEKFPVTDGYQSKIFP